MLLRAIGCCALSAMLLLQLGCGNASDRSSASPSPSVIAVTNQPATSVPSPPPTAPVGAKATTHPAPLGSAPAMLPSALRVQSHLPVNYPEGFVHYATIDRLGDEGRVRRLFINAEALPAIAAGKALPPETIFIMEVYRAQRDEHGQLLTNPAGHLIPEALEQVVVRLQLDDSIQITTAPVPAGIQNGSWDYVTLDPVNARIASVNNTACHACHVQAEDWEYAFTYPKLALRAESGQPQYDTCALVGRRPCQLPNTTLP